jgi:hypothetical protein
MVGTNALLEGATLDNSTSTASSQVRTAVSAADIHAVMFPAETLGKREWKQSGRWCVRVDGPVPWRRWACVSVNTEGPVCHSSLPSPFQQRDLLRRHAARPGDVEPGTGEQRPFLTLGCPVFTWHFPISTTLPARQDPAGKGGGCIFGFPYLDTLDVFTLRRLCPAGVRI